MKHLGHVVVVFLLLPLAAAAAQDRADPNRRARRTPIVEAVEKVRASVVNISTERTVLRRRFGDSFGFGDDQFDRLFEDFFRDSRLERRKVQTPLGSGCIITPDGLMVTNEHVVRRASNIKLSLGTGEAFEATLLAADVRHDLALLRAKVDKPFQSIPMGTSSDLMLGETVVALGNPYGFENSVTSGIISAFNREITVGRGQDAIDFKGLIQTSALINPGNSGGPLINVLGELVGINTAVVDQAQGIGFAIPIDRARDVLAPLLSSPHVSEAWPGIETVTAKGRRGARISALDPKGPARQRLEKDDVIQEIDGVSVRDAFDFLLTIVQHRPGDSVSLKVLRNGTPKRLKLTLGRLPEPSPQELLSAKFGLTGQNMTPTLARQLRVAMTRGVLISDVVRDGPAAKVGLRRGDVIVQIGAYPVADLRAAGAALRTAQAGRQLFVMVVRKRWRAYTHITVEK